jgi:hypothetical protein
MFVIGIVKLPFTMIVSLGMAVELGLIWLAKKLVESSDNPNLTKGYNYGIEQNIQGSYDWSDIYEDMLIEESKEGVLGES